MEKFQKNMALITGPTNRIGSAAAREEFTNESLVVQKEADSSAGIGFLIIQVKSRFRRLDVLFLNAGIATAAPVDHISEAN